MSSDNFNEARRANDERQERSEDLWGRWWYEPPCR
jgi:hypothetical protein